MGIVCFECIDTFAMLSREIGLLRVTIPESISESKTHIETIISFVEDLREGMCIDSKREHNIYTHLRELNNYLKPETLDEAEKVIEDLDELIFTEILESIVKVCQRE